MYVYVYLCYFVKCEYYIIFNLTSSGFFFFKNFFLDWWVGKAWAYLAIFLKWYPFYPNNFHSAI